MGFFFKVTAIRCSSRIFDHNSQIRAVVGKAGGVALARSLGGQGANWLANAEASESSRGSQGLLFEASTRSSAWLSGPGADSRGGGREDIFGGVLEGEDGIPEFALTMEDLEQGERSLPPPNSTMKMGSAKIPQVRQAKRFAYTNPSSWQPVIFCVTLAH